MANIKSAQKQARQNEKRRIKNLTRKTALKTSIKKVVQAAVDKKLSTEEINILLNDAQARLARAVSKGVMHKNTARRKISRIAKSVSKAYRQ